MTRIAVDVSIPHDGERIEYITVSDRLIAVKDEQIVLRMCFPAVDFHVRRKQSQAERALSRARTCHSWIMCLSSRFKADTNDYNGID
jgi:hypothetical protein